MRCTNLLVVALLLMASFGSLAAQAAGNTTSSTRRLVFPKQPSLGTLYCCVPNPKDRVLPEGSSVARESTLKIGEARGEVNAPAKGFIYLRPSYDVVAHPEVLRKIDPNCINCIFFNKVGIVTSMDNMIEPISHLIGLKRLDMQYAEIPDDSLKPLKSLTNLEALNLDMCSLKGTFLKDITTLTQLKELDLSDSKLAPDSYQSIAQFHDLKVLNLVRTEIDDKGLAEIAKLKNLEVLLMDSAKISPKGLKTLLALKKLNHLELTGVDLRPADLLCLAPLKLGTLFLPHRLSSQEMEMLHKAMPGTCLGLRNQHDDSYNRTLFAPIK